MFELTFKNEAKVSTGDEPDFAVVKFWGASRLLTTDGKRVFA